MNPKHLILTLLLMLCPIGMAAQGTITRNKPKPTVTKHKPAAKPKAKLKAKSKPKAKLKAKSQPKAKPAPRPEPSCKGNRFKIN